MGDKRVYVDDDGQQYYLDEDGEIVYLRPPKNGRIHPSVQAAIITGIFGIIIAIIALFPVNSPGEPYKPVIVAIFVNNNEQSYLTQTPNAVETSVVQTLTAIAPTPDGISTIVAGTLTASVPTQRLEESTPTIIVVTSSPVPVTVGITGADLDGLLGRGNWFCYPDRRNGVAVRNLPRDFLVIDPIVRIDNPDGTFRQGQRTVNTYAANAELDGNIQSFAECPSFQQQELGNWQSNPPDNMGTYFDSIFGSGGWRCDASFTYKIIVRELQNGLYVRYPFTAIDIPDGSTRYGVGETVPATGEVNVWTFGVPRDQCP